MIPAVRGWSGHVVVQFYCHQALVYNRYNKQFNLHGKGNNNHKFLVMLTTDPLCIQLIQVQILIMLTLPPTTSKFHTIRMFIHVHTYTTFHTQDPYVLPNSIQSFILISRSGIILPTTYKSRVAHQVSFSTHTHTRARTRAHTHTHTQNHLTKHTCKRYITKGLKKNPYYSFMCSLCWYY